jgi:signal transduction histidine kinase
MKYIVSILAMVLILSFEVKSQQGVIDSIEKQLKGNIADSMRAMSLMRLAIDYETLDTIKSARYYKEAIAFSSSKNLFYELGRTYFNRAILLSNGGHYDMAKTSLDSAMYFLEKSSAFDALFRKAQVYSQMANNARYQNEFQKSIEYQLKSAAIFEKLDKLPNLLNVYLNISSFYKEQNEFEKQEVYVRKAIEVAKKTGAKADFFKTYCFLAFALNMQNKYKEAGINIDSSRKYYTQDVPYEVLVTYHLIAALVYMNLNQLDSSKSNFQQTLIIAEKNNAVFSIVESKLGLGRILTLQKKYQEAEKLLLAVSGQIKATNEKSQWIISLDYLSRLYDESGNYKKAVFYYKEFKEVSDSISSEQNKQYASGLEVKYETEKKETQIRELQAVQKVQDLSIRQKNILNGILIGAAVTILLLSILGYRNYKQKQKLQQQRITELETLQHLSATEAVLKGEEQERTRLARDLHDGLGGMLSGIKYSLNTMKGNLIMTPDNHQAFERSMDMLDSSIKEMRRVAHNMMPEALVKFGLDTALKDYCNDINQTGALQVRYQSIGVENTTIEQTTAITIYRIVQELINNIVKHAAAKNAIVQVSKTTDKTTVTVEDDGKGFDPEILKHAKGIGWSNIISRVDFLKGNLDVQSLDGKGTSVHIELTT